MTFHQPWIRARLALLEKSSFTVRNLGTVVNKIQYGTGSPPPYLHESEKTVPFVRATDIKDGEINLETLLHVDAKQPKHMDKCRLAGDELIIVRSGVNTGDCAVVPESLANSFAAYDLIITLRPEASAKFVAAFLDTETGRLQLNLVKGRAAQPHINAEEVTSLQIPLPPLREQKKLAVWMDAARAERKAKLAEANALLAGLDDFLLDALGIKPPSEDPRRVFAIKRGDVNGLSLGAPLYAPELRRYFGRLRSNPAVTKPLSAYVEVNPQFDLPGLDADALVGFIPMHTVSDGATGEYTVANRPLSEVSKGYTPFVNGDILWAKITPCMQNGKSCIVDGLPNGVGFGSTEFHVLRVRDAGISKEFVMEFVSQASLRHVATYAFTGSAGQQRVPATFLEALPFPELPKARQNEIVASMKAVREEARRLCAEAQADWQAAKHRFEEQVLGSERHDF